ncbi:MAG: coenzyme F420-0:L-glutamate ligase [Methanomicrobiales archaeon]|jgi:coenzyme F420-0:L-glutamate ligase/coenzyme F420-1:gamma-L-glutamate ligase|nr:coenzyme F420-0:L-glutamate ligase [Methanomicrobiales archaeon]
MYQNTGIFMDCSVNPPKELSIQIFGIDGLKMIERGDDIAALICSRFPLCAGDIVTIASTIVSKAQGYTKELQNIVPGQRATRIAEMCGEDPAFMQVVLDEAVDIVLEVPFTLTELSCGHIGVRSGVDNSNVERGIVLYLPPNPMAEAKKLRDGFLKHAGVEVGVIITDTCGRAFRRGQIGHAIGWSGMVAIRDFRGDTDLFGHTLEITEEAVVDEIAGFSNFVMGESNAGIPAVVLRGCVPWQGHDSLYFSKDEDIIRKALTDSHP